MTRSMQIVLFAALLAGCVGKGKYTAKELEASQAQRQFQDEAARAKDLEAKVADLEGKLAASHQSLKKTETELAAVEEKSSQYEQLNKSLEGQIKSGQIELSELKGKMTVKLKDKILFGSDGPWLHPGVELAKVRALGLSRSEERLVLGDQQATATDGHVSSLAGPSKRGRSN